MKNDNPMKNEVSCKAIIDRFEGEYAVILLKNEEVIMKKNVLPENAKQGDILNITFKINKTATEKRKKEVKDILNELT